MQKNNCVFRFWRPGLSSHRYSVIFSADSEIFAFSAMFRAEPADFNFDISGHNWFSDEHFWTSLIQRWTLLASSKQSNTMKKAKKSVFFSILMLKRREIKDFRITFNGLFWKIRKMWFFPKSVFSFDSMSKDFLTRTKLVTDTKIPPVIGDKNVTGVIFDVFTVFLKRTCKVSAPAMFMAESEEISNVQSWISIFQKWCRENKLFSELIQ